MEDRDSDVGLAQIRGRRERGRLGEQQEDVAGIGTCVSVQTTRSFTRFREIRLTDAVHCPLAEPVQHNR